MGDSNIGNGFSGGGMDFTTGISGTRGKDRTIAGGVATGTLGVGASIRRGS